MKRRPGFALCVLSLVVGFGRGGIGQTQYTEDGETGGIEEEARWYANRARYSPPKEKERLSLTNSVPTGPIPPLAPNAKLITAAEKHSEDMAKTDIFQHNSPTGSVYYPADFQFWQRITNETYTYWYVGENIAAGTSRTSGKYPHDAWFLSESGHRENLLNTRHREIGLGHYYYGPSTYDHYYTEDLAEPGGSRSSWHWFTGTIFSDAGNEVYDYNEGIAAVDIYLKTSSVIHAWYDRSSGCGSFAVPIQTIADGTTVEVILENHAGSNVTVSIPYDFETLLSVSLTNGESRAYGTFVQPGSVKNVGFRDVTPYAEEMSGVAMSAGDSMQISAATFAGGTYVLQWRASLTAGAWSNLVTNVATSATTAFVDEGGSGCPHPTNAPMRFYRVALLKDL